jgi:hypothetical protein
MPEIPPGDENLSMRVAWWAMKPQLRRRWGTTAALVVLVGLAGGTVLAARAGASRTDSAMGRFVTYSRPEDIYVTINGADGDPADPAIVAKGLEVRKKVLALPQVAAAGRSPYLFMVPSRTGGALGQVNPFAAADLQMLHAIDRPLVVAGRLPDPAHEHEAVADDATAAAQHWHVGSTIRMWAYTAEQNAAVAAAGGAAAPAPAGPGYTFVLVGIVREPTTVARPPVAVTRDASYKGVGGLYLTPRFLQRYAQDQGTLPEALPGMEGYRIRLRHGLADLGAFERGVARLVAPGDGQTNVGSDIGDAARSSRRAFHLEAMALWAFAGLAAAAGVLVLGPPLARHVLADAQDAPTLAALGMDRRQLTVVPLGRATIVAVAGAVVSVAVAVALSPLAPVGLARRAEIHPGLSVNVAVLVTGFAGVVAVVLGWAGLCSWRASRSGSRRPIRSLVRPSPVTRLGGSSLGPVATAGVAMAFERRRGLGPRTAIVGMAVAVAGVMASITVGASLRHLVDTPREQGWNWDVIVGNPNSVSLAGDPAGAALHQAMVQSLSGNDDVGSFAGFAPVAGATVDGRPVGLVAIERHRGRVYATMVEGRPARHDDEVVLGRDVLDQIGKRIGDEVTIAVGEHSVAMTIVGAALQPTAGDESTRLSEGGALSIGALADLGLTTPVVQFVVSYRPGVDRDAARQSLIDEFGRVVLQPYPGGEVGDVAQLSSLPYVLAGLLVVLALGALVVILVGSVRRHRRDLAVLMTMGCVGRQIVGTTEWQATALAVTALVVGVPAGLLLGRWAWQLVAHSVGSVSPVVVPGVAMLIVVAATVVLAGGLAFGPGWAAARAEPVDALRTE